MNTNLKITDQVEEISPGRKRKVKILNESYTGINAHTRAKVLGVHSITDQLRALRKAVLSGDLSQLAIQDQEIDDIIKGS